MLAGDLQGMPHQDFILDLPAPANNQTNGYAAQEGLPLEQPNHSNAEAGSTDHMTLVSDILQTMRGAGGGHDPSDMLGSPP